MKNPFPGMDPWMEARWAGVRPALLVYGSDMLRPSLPAGLAVRIEERNVLGLRPTTDDDAVIDRLIAIRERLPSGRLVAVIEVLSSDAKVPGDDRDAYRDRRQSYLDDGIPFVEIDLLRGGERTAFGPPDGDPDELPKTEYRVTVGWGKPRPYFGWAKPRPYFGVYPISLRERLPAVPVPLGAGRSDVALDLQALIDRAYDADSCDAEDYAQDPVPSLSSEDAVWAAALLAEHGLA